MDSQDLTKFESITNRNIERKQNLQLKNYLKESSKAQNESLEYFLNEFKEKRQEIDTLLETSKNVEKTNLTEHFDRVSKAIQSLQRYTTDSVLFLRNYDMRRCQETLQEFDNKLKSLENELMPKRKFCFKNKNSISCDVTDSSIKIEKSHSVKSRINFSTINCGFSSRENEILKLEPEKILRQDVDLVNLNNCKVFLLGTPATVHISKLVNCYVICGPVSSSIFVEDCIDCFFAFACQQLRMHSSTNCQVYLHVTSKAIVEDCKGIAVAEYNINYTNLDDDYLIAGLSKQKNNWSQLDDFNWLVSDKPSPNWRVMNDSEKNDLNSLLLEFDS